MTPLRIATITVCLIALLGASAVAQVGNPVVTSLKVSPKSAKPGDEATVELTVDVSTRPDQEGKTWHIYPRAKEHNGVETATTLTATSASGELTIGDVKWPKPQILDPLGESKAVYEGRNVFKLPVKIKADAAAGSYDVSLVFGYQACASLCLAPQKKKLKATIKVARAATNYKFSAPEIMKADGKVIEVESPGYAAPCFADVDGDGIRDLLVGQYNEGKLGFYKGLKTKDGGLAFAAREWLKVGDEIAKVPGMW